jgi:hypothetical protein
MATKDAPNELTARSIYVQSREDCDEIRKRLGLSQIITGPAQLNNISTAGLSLMWKKRRKYLWYQMGHMFISCHIVASLTNDMSLTDQEGKFLKSVIGRSYYNPQNERYFRIDSANALDRDRNRSTQIFKRVKAEYDSLYNMSRNFTDCYMFSKPLGLWISVHGNERNFGEFAESERESIKFIEKILRVDSRKKSW